MTVPVVTLNNGVTMPQIGLGVYKIHEGQQAQDAVRIALEAGYRSIDTAALYGNEHSVGQALATSNIPRKDICITTKVWNADQGYDSTLRAFEVSLHRLGTDYVDLYLIHWPVTRRYTQTWRALEELQRQGVARAIGVSNFQSHHLDHLLQEAQVMPAVNQIEMHPRLTQVELRRYCRDKGIVVEAWSPLMHGGAILGDPTVVELGKRYHKTPAQIILRWHIQSDVMVIPKSATPERIRQDIDIFDFELSDEDMGRINGLNRDERIGPDPDTF